MSLNGDVTVIRNGRSTSTISIYNYPEHLNPFYEDDQHKRLRFWPINKKDDEGRRNSFSLGGLKDMWAFKSFRTKKKSSTLGINKTSESPPTLRRAYPIDSNNLFNSYDRRARYSSNDGDNFQRNAPYRSSLQNVQSTQPDSPSSFGLNRNDQYRSTIQIGNRTQTTKQTLPVPQPRRYVYGGSVTPQPSRNSEFGRGYTRDILAHGSSQTSISTNPFDSDNDEESEQIHSSVGATLLSGKRTPRKKRRAPAPPTPIHSTNGTSPTNGFSPESSQGNRPPQPELRIEEDLDIANLTAEIESFVKTKNSETPEREIKVTTPKEVPPPNKDLPKTNGTIPKAKPILKTSPNMVITKEFKPKPRNTELQINEELKIEEKPALPEKKRIQHTPAARQSNQQIGNVECIHVHVESPRSTPERDAANRVTSFKQEPKTTEEITAKTSFTLASPPSNRREISNDVTVKKTIQVTTIKKDAAVNNTEKVKPLLNGVANVEVQQITETTANNKPRIATKPTIETNSKVHNNFAIINKPGRHVVLNNETKETVVPSSEIIETKEIVIKEVQTPSVSSETTETTKTVTTQDTNTSEIKTKRESNGTLNSSHVVVDEIQPIKSKLKAQSTNQKHVVFKTEETNVQVIPVPERRTSVEKKPEKITVTLTQEKKEEKVQSSNQETLKENKTHNILTLDAEAGAQSLPPYTVNNTTTLEIIESEETPLQIEKPNSCTSSSVMQSANVAVTPKPRTTLLSESREEFEALYRNRPCSHGEWKQSTLAPLESNVPPERRRSVKDIIESINRSQRLLHAAAHKDLPELITTRSLPPPSYSEVVDESRLGTERHSKTANNDLSQTLQTLDEAQRELETILPTTSVRENGAAGPSHLGNHNTNETDTQKPNNDEIFKKCRVNKEVYDYRETSPTASNLDWNPVPKPKRTKNLNDQQEH